MKITLLGTGTSYPDPERVQSGVLVQKHEMSYIIDIGSGTLHRMTEIEFDFLTIDAVFISHFHVDHCSDFLALIQTIWLLGYDRPLNVYGPPPIKEWWRGLSEVALPFYKDKIKVIVYEIEKFFSAEFNEIKVTTAPTTHSIHDVRAYRIDSPEGSIVYSADTAPCEEVIELARGAEILLHECNWLDGEHPEGVHTSPSELASVVADARPRKVVLTHVSPEVVANEDEVISLVKGESDIEVVFGRDLMDFKL